MRNNVTKIFDEKITEYEAYGHFFKKKISPQKKPDLVNAPKCVILFLYHLLNSGNYQNVMKIYDDYILETYCVSYTTLYRYFLKYIGLTPKEICSILLCLDIVNFYSSKLNLFHIQEYAAAKFGFKQRESLYRFVKQYFGCNPKDIYELINDNALSLPSRN